MAGKSYIKGPNNRWTRIKKMYIKTGPTWTAVRKAYIKTGNLWKKVFDSSTYAMYTTEIPTIRLDSYTGTVVSSLTLQSYEPTGESRIGIKLYGRENPASWVNGPYVSQKYQWYVSDTKNGANAVLIKDTSDTYYVGSSENNTDYDGKYLFFRAIYTNSSGIPGVANSYPVYVHKSAPSKMTGASGGVSGITSTATEVNTPITFEYYWHNEYYRSIDIYNSTIEWFRGYPLSDKSNLVQSESIWATTNTVDNTTEYSGYTTYTPGIDDVGSTIYVVMTGVNTYNTEPLASVIGSSPNVSTFNTATPISQKPVINAPVVITKTDGYQTEGYLLTANTKTYTPTATTVYWGWQWASSATAANSSWRALQTRYYSPIYGGFQITNKYGSESSENVDHQLYIPSTVYDGSNDVSLIGKYLRFYSIGEANGAQSIVNYSTNVIGPIYALPTSASNLSMYYSRAYNSSYVYAYAQFDAGSNVSSYTIQYNNNGTWTNITGGTGLTTAPDVLNQIEILVPVGTKDYRVVSYNAENAYAISTTYTFSFGTEYSFGFGNDLYVDTNGWIGLTAGFTGYSSIPSTGFNIGIWPKDLRIGLPADITGTGYVKYWSDGSDFHIYVKSYQLGNENNANYALDYIIKFNPANAYADVKYVRKGSSLGAVVFAQGLYYGGQMYKSGLGPNAGISAGTFVRYYFNGNAAAFGNSFTTVPEAAMITPSSPFSNNDDGYYQITTAKNQYTPSYLTNVTDYTTANSTSISFTGNADYSYYSYKVTTTSYNGSVFSSGTNQTANPLSVGSLPNQGTNYYVTITPYNSLGQVGTPYQITVTTSSQCGPFNVTSVTKNKPATSTTRPLITTWGASSGADHYEVEKYGSNDNTNWTLLQDFASASYITDGTTDALHYNNQISVTSTLKSAYSNYFTVTTSYPHYFTAGQSVTIANSTYTATNNTWTIYSVDSPTTFSVYVSNVNTYDISGTGGTATSLGPYLASYYKYYKTSVRARKGIDATTLRYSDGGTSSTPAYTNATGTAPGVPSIGTITVGTTTASAAYTWPTDSGSNGIDWIQFSLDQTTWYNDYVSPFDTSTPMQSLTSGTDYTLYARSLNLDGLTSSIVQKAFSTNKAVTAPTSLTASTTDSAKITLTWSGGYGDGYQIYYVNANSATDTTSWTQPTNTQTNYDFSSTSSPLDILSGAARGTYRRIWIRAWQGGTVSSPTTKSNWYPSLSTGILGYSPLYAPYAPTSPTTSGITDTNITFGWTASSAGDTTHDDAASYDYYTSTTSTAPTSTTTPTGNTTSTSVSFTYTSSSSPTKQYFWVRAINADAKSAWTTSINATPNAAKPTNSVAPTITTDNATNTIFAFGNKITISPGTWSGANSYAYELLYGAATPVPTTASTKTLDTNGQYTITLADATNSSYYFRGKVTAYTGANQTGTASDAVYTTTSSRSIIVPTTTISVGTATATGFTISGTAGPTNGTTAYVKVNTIYIYNSSKTLLSTITTSMPTVSGTDGTWSYTWTGGSASTAYYARVKVVSTDTDVTAYTTDYSASITTLASPPPDVSFSFNRGSGGTTSPYTATTYGTITASSSGADSITWKLYRTASGTGTTGYGNTNTYTLYSSGTYTGASFTITMPLRGYYYLEAYATKGSVNSANTKYSNGNGQTGTNVNWFWGLQDATAPTPTNTIGSGQYTFSWSGGTSGAQAYNIQYGTNSSAPSPNPPSSVVGNIQTGSVVATSSPYTYYVNTAYYSGFRVQAYDPIAGVGGPWSVITTYK